MSITTIDDPKFKDIIKLDAKSVDIILAVYSFFQDAEKTALFMATKNLNFGGFSPNELILRGRGLKVLAFVESALDGNKPPQGTEPEKDPIKHFSSLTEYTTSLRDSIRGLRKMSRAMAHDRAMLLANNYGQQDIIDNLQKIDPENMTESDVRIVQFYIRCLKEKKGEA